MWKKIKQCNFLVYTLFYTFFLGFLKYELNIFEIELMDWFYYFSLNFIYFTAIIGIYQFFSKMEKRSIKIITILILLILTFLFFTVESLFYEPSYIVEKNSKKMEVVVFYEYKLPTIQCYTYINPFMRSFNSKYNKTLDIGAQNPFIHNSEYRQYLKFSLPHSITNFIIPTINKITATFLEPLL